MSQEWRTAAVKILSALESTLFPATCAGCGRVGVWLCSPCRAGLRPVPRPICGRCGRPRTRAQAHCPHCSHWPAGADRIRAAFLFEGAVQQSIHRFKYQGEYARGRYLAELLAEYVRELALELDASWDLIVPVALHPRRRHTRGFNQAEILGEGMARLLGIPLHLDGLVRPKNTRPQVGLNLVERRENLNGAFRWVSEPLAGARVLLVDDVVTTGATMTAAAVVIHRAGASGVDGVALASQH